MGAPVALLLVVGLSGGEVRSGQLRATLNAQLDAEQVSIEVRRADGVRNLDKMLDAASSKGPVAVVTNPARGKLLLRVALKPGTWVRRTFTFDRRDPLRERNRTVALAIAAMTPQWRLPVPLPEPERESVTSVPKLDEQILPAADAGLEVSPPPLDRERIEAPDAGPLPELSAEAEPLVENAPPEVWVAPVEAPVAVRAAPPDGLAFEAAALGSGWPLGIGAQVGGDGCFGPLCVGLLLQGQRATLAQAQLVIWQAGVLLSGQARIRLGLERLLGAFQLSVGPQWTLAQRGEQSQSRWQLRVELGPELSVRVFSTVWLFVRGGVGLNSGVTSIFVNELQVAELPVVSGQAAVGIRIGR